MSDIQEYIDEIQGELENSEKSNTDFIIKFQKILKEINNFCEECPSHDCCPENECVLYRIEKIMEETE